ncbi:MAG TPA: hypothetical protein VGN24_00925 [Rhodanobacter sp.]|jgi:hypothetical protein|nr:hypothetical protein [Rhodanobacter sp.]
MAERPFGHESSAINTQVVLTAVGILAAFVVIAVGVLHVVLHHAVMPEHAQVVTAPGAIPPEPRLQPHPQQDIALERAQKQRMLSRYGWLDGSRRFARIPIDRAMQLYVKQHGDQVGPAAPSTKDLPGVPP